MPQRAKSRLGPPKPRRKQPAWVLGAAAQAVAADAGMEQPEPDPKRDRSRYADARLELHARLAWLEEYSTVYELEAEVNGAAATVEHH